MKQTVISYLSTITDDIFSVNDFIYNTTENSYEETKTSKFLMDLLQKYDFNITPDFCSIPNAFYAEIGSGHPKVCLICKYSTLENHAHSTAVNASSTISIGAALGLTKVISDFENGSLIVVGCPGNDVEGSELTMANQGCFEDIDVIISPKVYNKNVINVASACITPLKIEFTSNASELGYANTLTMDALNITCNSLNSLVKNLCDRCDVNFVSMTGEKNPYKVPSKAEGQLYIRTKFSSQCEDTEHKIRNYISAVGDFLNIDSEANIHTTPCKELIPIRHFNKLFEGNLKEKGIIDFEESLYEKQGLSIGALSHTSPCIVPHISICKRHEAIPYPSEEFAKLSFSDYGKEKILFSIEATTATIIDLMQRPDLLQEITNEFYNRLEYHTDKSNI